MHLGRTQFVENLIEPQQVDLSYGLTVYEFMRQVLPIVFIKTALCVLLPHNVLYENMDNNYSYFCGL